MASTAWPDWPPIGELGALRCLIPQQQVPKNGHFQWLAHMEDYDMSLHNIELGQETFGGPLALTSAGF